MHEVFILFDIISVLSACRPERSRCTKSPSVELDHPTLYSVAATAFGLGESVDDAAMPAR